MSPVRPSVAIFLCVCVVWTWALPKRPASGGASSGAGEIPDELPIDYRPFDGPFGKGSPGNEVFNNYDLDSEEGPRVFTEYDENDIPHSQPQGSVSESPLRPNDRIPEDKHPEDGPKEAPEEEEDHEPEETHDDEEEEVEIPGGEENESPVSEEKDPHAVEDEKKPYEGEEEDTHEEKKPHESEEGETREGQGEIGLPLKPSLFSFHQVNHYIKQLEKAMDNAFKETLEESASLNNTFANTTEEEVQVNGHKYKVHKSIIKTGDEDSNSTLFVEAVSSVNEDEPKNRSERSNPDAVPNQ